MRNAFNRINRAQPGVLYCLVVCAVWSSAAVAQDNTSTVIARLTPEQTAQGLSDPFEQATAGLVGCNIQQPKPLSPDELHAQAHGRVERGTSCLRDPHYKGWCPAGGAYSLDGKINRDVILALRADAQYVHTRLWVSTSRGMVTVQGCVPPSLDRKRMVQTIKRIADVQQVFDDTTILSAHPKH